MFLEQKKKSTSVHPDVVVLDNVNSVVMTANPKLQESVFEIKLEDGTNLLCSYGWSTYVNLRTLMGCTDPLPMAGVWSTLSVFSRDRTLFYGKYADVRNFRCIVITKVGQQV